MENLTSLLKKNTELRDRYVAVATIVVDAATKGLNRFMKHLLVVQDIDPNTQPGNRSYEKLSQQLKNAFDMVEPDDYDGPRDEDSWLQTHLAKAQGKYSHLSKDAFKKLTDLSHVPDRKEEVVDPLQVALSNGKTIKEVMESETPVYTASDQDTLAKIAAAKGSTVINCPIADDEFSKLFGGLNSSPLKEALETLQKYASKIEDEKPKEVVYSGRSNSVGISRRYPVFIKTVKDFRGCFRRVEDKKE